ncbi:MAG: phosphatase PAP2 family protein [Clostridia bacterium]|nr:phosphatase PAP2 family protein [Clostridia bacterium]
MLFGTEAFELTILEKLHGAFSCGFMDWLMKAFSTIGNAGIVWILVVLIMLAVKKYRKTGFMMAAGLILGLIIGNLVLKNVVARPRPCWLDDGIRLLISNPTDYSFPSGHTLASFVSAFVLLGDSKRLGIPALIVAAFIAFSRMYLFVHFPTDIFGGILLAWLIVFGMKSFVKWYKKLAQNNEN